MSPEQARGDRVDHRSDLFSLGSVLYAMGTGRPPFRAETSYGVLRRITDSKPRPVCELNPEMPTWLCRVIEKLHATSPDDRYESAAEVGELLEQCLAHVQEPMTVPLPESLLRVSQEKERLSSLGPRRLWAGGIAAAVLALATIVGLAIWRGPPKDAAQEKGKANEIAPPGTLRRGAEPPDDELAKKAPRTKDERETERLKEIQAVLTASIADLDKRQAVLERLISEAPSESTTEPALGEVARITLEWAGLLLKLAITQTNEDKQPTMQKARREYERAHQRLTAWTDAASAALTEMQVDTVNSEEKDIVQLLRLRSDKTRSLLLRATCLEETADAYESDEQAANAYLSRAAEAYGQIHRDYRPRITGFQACMCEGRCYQKLGQINRAMSLYGQVVDQPDSLEAFRSLKTKTLVLAMQCWLDPSQRDYDKAIREGKARLACRRQKEIADPDWQELKRLLDEATKLKAEAHKGPPGLREARPDVPTTSSPAQIAVVGIVDLDRDGVDDASDLTKWGFQVVARVTPDGRRIGPQLTEKVRFLVVGKRPSAERVGQKPDGQPDSLDQEAKRMRDEAARLGIAAISASHLQKSVSAAAAKTPKMQNHSTELRKENRALRDALRSAQLDRDKAFGKMVELTDELHGMTGKLKRLQDQQCAETPEAATEVESEVPALPPITKAAVIGGLDLDQDGVDVVQELMQPKNKWGIQVVAHVTSDGRRIGPPLTGAEVRYLVADEVASEEEPAVTADGPLAQFARESKKMRDEASENGARLISPGEFQTYIATILKERRGHDCEDARCRFLIDQIGRLRVDRQRFLGLIAEIQSEIIEVSKPVEIPEDPDEETVAQLAELKRRNDEKARQVRFRVKSIGDNVRSIDAQIKLLRRRLANFPSPPTNVNRRTPGTAAESDATTSRQSGNEDHLEALEAKHKELVREREDLFTTVIVMELTIVDLELPVLIPDQLSVISMDPDVAELEAQIVKEELELLRQEKLSNQKKVEAVRERLSSFQAELRGVERQIELLEQRMDDLKPGSAQADEQQREKIVVTKIKDANLAVPLIIDAGDVDLPILPTDVLWQPCPNFAPRKALDPDSENEDPSVKDEATIPP